MSRPDDSIASNLGAPQAGPPTGWPRPQEQVARDPATGRAIAPAPTEQWQGGQGYHFPGPTEHDQGQHQAPAPVQQHYQPPAHRAAPRTQPGGHGGSPGQGDLSPQFARYSGATDAAPGPGYAVDPYQPARTPAEPQSASWPPAGGQPQHYATAGAQPGGDPHWPGERLPYQNLTTGEPRSYDPNAYAAQGQDAGQLSQYGQYAPPAQGYADPQAGYQQQAYQGGYQDAGYQGQFATPEQGYDPRTGQSYGQAGYMQGEAYGQGYAPNGGGLDAGQPIAGQDGGYEGDFAEPPPRKRRGLLVAGALVCAVAIGGGLAFVYKTFGQSGKRIGAPPIVAKSNMPPKAVPTDPQGKQFENTNKKVLAKLDDAGGSTSLAAAGASPASAVPGMIVSMPPGPAAAQPVSNDTSAPSTRTVQTVPIGRDGKPVNGEQAVVTPRGLPGVQIDNSLNAPPAMRGAIPAADTPPPAAAKPQPQRLAATPPAATERPETPAAVQPAPPRKAPIAKVAKDPAAPAAAAASGSGYVAVLSSQKDRAAALRIYADLAQKYPDQLGSRQPEVQEATVADKGVFQRLVVGPPSSQQSAKELCTQLKAAGYASDCWVKQY